MEYNQFNNISSNNDSYRISYSNVKRFLQRAMRGRRSMTVLNEGEHAWRGHESAGRC